MKVGRPFFGVTVTVTLHGPAFNPFNVAPDTLQYFVELRNTFSDTFDVEATSSLAYLAMDFAVADLTIFTLGKTARGTNSEVLITGEE